MSKLAKGFTKGVKKIFSGIKKFFKKVWDSKVGRVILIVAAVYFGGVALGAWNGFGAGGGAASAGETVLAGGDVAGTAVGGDVVGASFAGSGAEAGTSALLGQTASSATGGAVPQAVSQGVATGGSEAVKSGIVETITSTGGAEKLTGAASVVQRIRDMAGTAMDVVEKHPLPTMYAAQGLGAALQPSEFEQQEKYLERLRRRRERNLSVGNIDIGAPAPLRPFERPTRQTGYSGGIAESRMTPGEI